MVWKARLEIKKVGRGWVSGFRVSEKSLRLSLRAAPCVPRFERLVETSRLWSDVSSVHFRLFPRRNDQTISLFFTFVVILTRSTSCRWWRETFEKRHFSRKLSPILGWICNERRWHDGSSSARSSITTDLSWIFIPLAVTEFYSLQFLVCTCIVFFNALFIWAT